MKVLKQRELAEYRKELLEKQNGKCALCKQPLSLDEAVADHDHSTGHIRSVLHGHCNRLEGVFFGWLRGCSVSAIQWLANLMHYWQQDYSDNPIYPSHPADQTKKFKRLSKTDMIDLLKDIYPEMDLAKYTKSQLAKLYRDSWK
ncbi:TPA: hypothetical protein NK990_003902 [Vibrio parahaemolyticus]|nr:hypothetical protein [Vibrio parahaemolyticus]